MAEERYWMGEAPKVDDFGAPITKEFVDGRARTGGWGFFAPGSWLLDGCGKLGQGFGQRYVKQPDGRFKKVQG